MSKEFYDRMSGVYDLLADASESRSRSRGIACLGLHPGERALEIGFGTGHGLVEISRAVGPNGTVAGVDISEGMRAVAERRLGRSGLLQQVEIQLADVPPLPYDSEQFDAVFLSFTLDLFADAAIPRLLLEIRRVLVAEGRLGVVALDVTPASERDSLTTRTFQWMHRYFPHIIDCRPIDSRRLVSAAAFEIVHAEESRMWGLPVAILAARRPG